MIAQVGGLENNDVVTWVNICTKASCWEVGPLLESQSTHPIRHCKNGWLLTV